jgi:hypothetical protein
MCPKCEGVLGICDDCLWATARADFFYLTPPEHRRAPRYYTEPSRFSLATSYINAATSVMFFNSSSSGVMLATSS